jgi:hypothetical protein
MTYLWQLALAKNPNYASLGANFYYRPSLEDKLLLPTRTFTPGAVWNPQGDTTDTQGVRYMLSTMLAYTSGRGNSLAEVEAYLRASVVADGTYPAGRVYFLTNGDVRAKTREPAFKAAARLLENFGVEAQVVEGVLPQQKSDIVGAMIGAVDYRFADSGSHVHGGAICENLTSFGGILRENGGQTALTECLRAGAAGSSGTVTEPFAIQAKFPHPMIHAHYAQGCTLAEAFYQSVQGPYQLLIVGDPLCRPWATIPTIRASGLPAAKPVSGKLTLWPEASTVTGKSVNRYELYVDGRLAARCDREQSLEVDTAQWADGSHELRIVGYEDSPIATQGLLLARVESANHGVAPVEISVEPSQRIAWDQEITVRAAAPGMGALALYHQQRLVGLLQTDRGAWTLPANRLGMGPGEFQVVASRGAGTRNSALSRPVEIEIVPPAPAPALAGIGETKPGLRLLSEGKDPMVVERLDNDWAAKAGVEPGQPWQLEGIFRANTDDLYQLQVELSGEAEVLVDGKQLAALRAPRVGFVHLPVSLAAGPHRLQIKGKLDDAKRLNAAFGNRGTQQVTGELFQHAP